MDFIDNAGWKWGQDAGWNPIKGNHRKEAKFELVQDKDGRWLRVLKAHPTAALNTAQKPQLVRL